MAQTSNKTFLNSFFITKKEGVAKLSGKPYSFQKMGVKIDEAIKELTALKVKADSNGFVNFTINAHLNDPNKFSVQVDDFVPTPSTGGGSTATSGTQSTPKKADDDLPF